MPIWFCAPVVCEFNYSFIPPPAAGTPVYLQRTHLAPSDLVPLALKARPCRGLRYLPILFH